VTIHGAKRFGCVNRRPSPAHADNNPCATADFILFSGSRRNAWAPHRVKARNNVFTTTGMQFAAERGDRIDLPNIHSWLAQSNTERNM